MRISDWSSDVCSSDLFTFHQIGVLRSLKRGKHLWNECCRENVRSEEHTSELQSLMRNSYAVFCLKKKQVADGLCTIDIHNNKNMTTLYIRGDGKRRAGRGVDIYRSVHTILPWT